jgi:hypothetical protein
MLVVFFNSASTCDFDLIAISETWLSDCVYSSELVDHDLFSLFRCDRNFATLGLSRGGGVLLLARNTLSVEMVDVSAIRKSVPSLDVVCCKVMLKSLTNIHVFVLYFHPFLTTSDFLPALECLDLIFSSFSSKVLLVGDFNAPGFGCIGGGVSDSKWSAVTNFLSILNLSQRNVVYNDLGRLLDLLVADFNCEGHHDFLPMLIESRHHPDLFCSCTIELAKSFTACQMADVAAYNFRKADFVGLYRELMGVDWSISM